MFRDFYHKIRKALTYISVLKRDNTKRRKKCN